MYLPWKRTHLACKVPANCEYFTSQADMPRAALVLLEQYAYDHGESYDAYLATEDDRQYFWSPGRKGVIGFARRGRALHVLGGLLAAPEHQEQLLSEFLKFVRSNGLIANFMMISHSQAKLFRRHGFRLSKCGEELFVRLQQVNWQGKDYQWLRRQENSCVRKHLRVEEIDPRREPQRYRDEILPQLEEVNRLHLANTLHARELVFYEGRFAPCALLRRRLFVTWRGDQIEAFIVCNPALAGDMWAVEIYRRRPDAPPGIIPYSILQIMRQLKDEGATYASLSSVPFLRCGPPLKNDDLRFQASCQFFWNCMNWLFDVQGIYHFKSRFRPVYREMYLATYPRSTLRSLVSMLAVWQLHRVAPLRLARHVTRYWRGRHKRDQLAQPEPRPERKIRDLRRPRRMTTPVAEPLSTEPRAPTSPVGLEVAPLESSAYKLSET